MEVTVISSQTFRDESIIKEKMALPENWIHLSPPFIHDGIVKAVLMDGHHSLSASTRLSRDPLISFVEDEFLDGSELLFNDEIKWFLDWNKNDADWHAVITLEIECEPVNL